MTAFEERWIGTEYFIPVYSWLINVASQRGKLHYDQIGRFIGYPHGDSMASEVGHFLGEICQEEVRYGRPILSAVVVRKDTAQPGKGFIKMAKFLGKYKGRIPRKVKLYGHAFKFWQTQLESVYAIWSVCPPNIP